MHLCFVDESGTPAKRERPEGFFVVAGLIVPEERWHDIRQKVVGLKHRLHYRGELKWRYFAPNNRDAENPMLDWDQDRKNEMRAAAFSIINGQKSVRLICGICDARAAYNLGNVNTQEDLYFRTYKTITERFQYFLQDVTKSSGRFTSGIIISDHRNRGEDNRMREQHERLVRETGKYTSTYSHFIESIFLSPSHMSIGIQLVDMAAGAVWRRYQSGDETWFNHVRSALRHSPTGVIDGWGLMRFPKAGWTGPIVN